MWVGDRGARRAQVFCSRLFLMWKNGVCFRNRARFFPIVCITRLCSSFYTTFFSGSWVLYFVFLRHHSHAFLPDFLPRLE